MKQIAFSDNFQIKGKCIIKRIRNNKVVQVIESKNTIMIIGKEVIADLLGRAYGISGLTYIAIGTDDGTSLALATSNTKLGNEIGRQPIIYYSRTTGTSTVEATYSAYFESSYPSSTTDYTIKEVGMFSGGNLNPDTGSLFDRIILTSAVTKQAGVDSLSVDIKLTI